MGRKQNKERSGLAHIFLKKFQNYIKLGQFVNLPSIDHQ